jgi:hypothetical protein
MRGFGRALGTAALMAIVIFGSTAFAGVIAVEVEGGPGYQGAGMANSNWVTWTNWTRERPRHADALARGVKGDPFRLNARRTEGYAGGLSDDGDEAIYQQVSDRGSNVFLYDLGTQQRTPAPINTDRWEAKPSVSENYILFMRTARSWRIILYDRVAETSIVLDDASARCFCIFAGQVSDEYATWTDCSGRGACQVRYYDIGADSVGKAPNPFGNEQYYPGVSSGTGSIYFVRSGVGCGVNARIMRWNPSIGGEAALVFSQSPGTDFNDSLLVFADPGVHDDVYFGTRPCDAGDGDLNVVQDADLIGAGRVPVAGGGSGGAGRSRGEQKDLGSSADPRY